VRELRQVQVPPIDLPNGAMTSTLLGLAFTPDSKALVAGGSDQHFHAWDVATGKETLKRPMKLSRPPQKADADPLSAHLERLNAVALSPDRRTAVLGDMHDLYLLDTTSGQELCKLSAGQVV